MSATTHKQGWLPRMWAHARSEPGLFRNIMVMAALMVLGLGVGGYILSQQRFNPPWENVLIFEATFDMEFINAELELAGRPTIPPSRAIDTVAMARRNPSASEGVKPAATIAIFMACSWNKGTPMVLPSTCSNSFDGNSTFSSPLRRRKWGCTMSPWMGPGRTIATSITRS